MPKSNLQSVCEELPEVRSAHAAVSIALDGISARVVAKVVGCIGVSTCLIATLAWEIWGPAAGVAAVAFAAGLFGLARVLIDLYLRLLQFVTPGKRTQRVATQKTKWELAPLVVSTLLLGLALGLEVLPRLRDWATRPAAWLEVPHQVNSRQELRVLWRNIPQEDDVRLLVREQGQLADFIQPCRAPGSTRGMMDCEAEVGGGEDSGKIFEFRVIRLPRDRSEQLTREMEKQDYITRLPNEAQLVGSEVVKRQAWSTD